MSSTNGAEKKKYIHMQKDEIGLISYTSTKINSKWIKNLSLRLKFINLLEESNGENLLYIDLHNGFMDLIPKYSEWNINKQIGVHQTNKLLVRNKRNNQQWQTNL